MGGNVGVVDALAGGVKAGVGLFYFLLDGGELAGFEVGELLSGRVNSVN